MQNSERLVCLAAGKNWPQSASGPFGRVTGAYAGRNQQSSQHIRHEQWKHNQQCNRHPAPTRFATSNAYERIEF